MKIEKEPKMRSNNIEISLGTKKLIKIALAIQLAVLGLIGLDFGGIQIPILRQVICFIYLTFIPGILTLRILRLYKLSLIETVLYSVGLSLSFLTFTGVLINFLYPLIGFSRPISEIPLIITITLATFLLCFACYLYDKNNSVVSFTINRKSVFSSYVFSLMLLPFLAIFGSYLLNFYNANILLLLLLVIISVIPILVAIYKIPEELYPFMIWIISITLLFHTSLISTCIGGCDAPVEYYFSSLVIMNNFWNHTLPNNINAMPFVVILIPIFSIICDVDPTWYLKVIYPFLFSFAPLGLYLIFKEQTTSKIAFLSVFFFMSIPTFFKFNAVNSRQGIAEFFLILLILSMVSKNISSLKKIFLSIIFTFSIITSHYGLSYIFMLFLILAFILHPLSKKFKMPRFTVIGTPIYIMLYISSALSWYAYTSNSSPFDTIVKFFSHVLETLFIEFLNPESSTALYILTTELPLSLQILRMLIIISILFTFIGIVDISYKLIRNKTTNFFAEYFLFSLISFGALFASILPQFSIIMGIGRIFHILSIFLSPFCIKGGIVLVQRLIKTFKFLDFKHKDIPIKIIALFLSIFFLFSSNFVSVALIKDYPAPYLISLDDIEEYVKDGKINMWKAHVYNHYIMVQDVFGAKWLSNNKIEVEVWADCQSCWMPLSAYGMMGPQATHILTNKTKIDKGYIYLRHFNTKEGIMLSSSGRSEDWYNITDVFRIIISSNKIYTNGGSEIYYR